MSLRALPRAWRMTAVRAKTVLLSLLLAMFMALVLASVFSAYLQPGFVLDLANRVWLCF